MPEPMPDAQIADALKGLPGWRREGDQILRDFEFPDFVAALGFIVQVGTLAERADHHPGIVNTYNQVTLALSSHDAGGITDRDLRLAAEIDERAPTQ